MKPVLTAARAGWVLLPLTLGTSATALTDDATSAFAIVLAVLGFGAWFVGLLALLTPRPRSFTALRVVAPAAAALAVAATIADTTAIAIVALVHAIVSAGLVLSAPVADACTDGASYGRERRYPLRLPPQFALLALPFAIAVVVAGASAGPLLLADGRVAVGLVVTVVGFAAAARALRSLVSLEGRFAVLVPAGIVVANSFVLADPVLFPREHVRALQPADSTPPGLPTATPGVLDLRLGAAGALELVADEPAEIPCREGRRAIASVHADRVLFAPLRRAELLDGWTARGR